MDIDSDGRVTREEFMRSCLEDDNMMNLLTPPGWVLLLNSDWCKRLIGDVFTIMEKGLFLLESVLNVEALVGAFNQEKALIGAVIV